MDDRAESVRDARHLFQGERGGSTPTSALCLTLEVIEFLEAKRLNKLWHSRLPRMGTGSITNMPFLSFGAVFDGTYYAAAIWSNPVARCLPQQTWLELRRLAIAPDAPRNTASRMLGVMTRLIRKARPEVERLVSYQDTEVHTGGIYKAAGWVAVDTTKSCSRWDMPGRKRPGPQTDSPKVRWEKVIYERTSETGTDQVDPSGAEEGLPLPQRRKGRTERRDAPDSPSLWESPVDDC